MKTYFLFILMLVVSLQTIAQRYNPINPNASAEVKRVLNLLYDIKGKYILSGQQNYNSDLNTFSDSAKVITGKYPAIWGTDFINWGDKDLGPQIVDEAIKKWKENNEHLYAQEMGKKEWYESYSVRIASVEEEYSMEEL